MSFTNDMDLEVQASGAADWDTGLNANFQILEKGLTFRATAGIAIASQSIITVNSAGFAFPYDPRSLNLPIPHGFARNGMASGDSGLFTFMGVVRSLAVTSLVPGEPVFPTDNPASLGLYVSSIAGARMSIGKAVGPSAFVCYPKRITPEYGTITLSAAALNYGVGSAAFFVFPIGPRGYIQRMEVNANSLAQYGFKVEFHSNSSRVSSERVYETLTRSWAPNSSDVTSGFYLDGQGFPYKSTNTNSQNLIHARISVQSFHAVASGFFSITLDYVRH